jgi:hypothetical protein
MDLNIGIYPPKKYKCPTCNSNKIGFFVDKLDFTSLIMINSGNANLASLSNPKNYREFNLWQCKNCFDVGELRSKNLSDVSPEDS